MADITVASTTDSMESIKAAVDFTHAPAVTTGAAPEPDASPQIDPPADAPSNDPVADPEGGDPDTDEPDLAAREDGPTDSEPAKPIRERKRDLQSRIDDLVRDKYTSQRAATEAQREVERLRETLEEISSRTQPPPQYPQEFQPQAPPQTAAWAQEPEPQSDDFETFEEFTKATARWAAKSERRQLEYEQAVVQQQWAEYNDAQYRAQQEQQIQHNNNTLISAHYTRVDAAKADLPDFDEVIDQSENLELPPPMQAVILNEEMGPRIMYWLAQNPAECDRIARLAPTPQLVAMGSILATVKAGLTAGAAATQRKPAATSASRLPAPIKTVGTGSAQSTVALDELPYDQFREIRNQQERARRSR